MEPFRGTGGPHDVTGFSGAVNAGNAKALEASEVWVPRASAEADPTKPHRRSG